MASPSIEPLPPAMRSMWRLCLLGYRHEPKLMLVAFLLSQAAVVPDALLALGLALLGQGVLEHDPALIQGAALGLGVAAASTWFLSVISSRLQRRFRDKVTIALEAHVARLQASIPSIAHQERPEFLDRLAMLRNQVFVLDHMYMSLFSTLGWLLRLGITVALLMTVHPGLILLILFAVPVVLTSAWRPAVERVVQERGAPAQRLARHLFDTATTAPAAKEVRVTRLGQRLVTERRETWERWYGPTARTRWGTAAWQTLAWAIFAAGYFLAVLFVSSRFPAGPVILVLAAGSRLSFYVSATMGEIGFLAGFWVDGARRMAWLEDYAASQAAHAEVPVPERLEQGIRLEKVSFAYPGTTRRVLENVDLTLPAGSVVAIVGENGAGKSTLVKLLTRMYLPSDGAILIDGAPLGGMEAEAWRRRLAGAFQDFFRFELRAYQTVGLGDLPRMDDRAAVTGAVERAGATDVIEALRDGLETQLGPTWPQGVDVSFGQWQKLALSRGFMRTQPLLLVLDEPTAALDAETEHALFERYAEAARRKDPGGRITLLVSHRFSTVRMADLIVVLSGSQVAEVGTHEQLMARGGTYAELYGIQSAAYR